MINLRQAAQQALEALERINAIHYLQDLYEALDWEIDALRAALAEPEDEPFMVVAPECAERGCMAHDDRVDGSGIVVQLREKQEPQTTHWEGCEAVHPECRKPEPVVQLEFAGTLPISRGGYAPTPRKPLTDEEMRECAQAMNAEPLAEGWPELIKFARAIEHAHGITGDSK